MEKHLQVWALKRSVQSSTKSCNLPTASIPVRISDRGVPAYTQSTQLRTSIFECPKNKNVLNREKCNEKHASPGLGL